jgi:hypothetical protein
MFDNASTSVRGGAHASTWVANMIKDLARERLTATEIAIRYRTSIDTARRWLASFYDAGMVERQSRKAEKKLGAGRPEVEHWLAKHWGGEA